jgi:hypothetical protein
MGIYLVTPAARYNIKRYIKWADHVENTGEKRNTCTVLIGKLEGKRPLETTSLT